MTSSLTLEAVFEEIGELLGVVPDAVARRVVRVDVHPRRGTCVELDSGEGRSRWFRGVKGRVQELFVHEDERIPLCSHLGADPKVMAWRPGRRVVASTESGVVKGLRRGRIEGLARIQGGFHEAASRLEGIDVPAPLEVDPELDSMTVQRVHGNAPTLERESADTWFQFGEALSGLRLGLEGFPLPTFGHEDELLVLETWREKILQVGLTTPEGWEKSAAAVRAAGLELDRTEPVVTHRDLHDGQLLVDGGGIVLLDLDLACLADPLLDPANLLVHMELRLLQGLAGATRAGVDACSEALLEGLGESLSEGWQRLRFYQASTFLRLALVYSLRPRWAHLREPLVRYARRCLIDLARSA